MSLRQMLKSAANGVALVAALPVLASFKVRSVVIGRDRALESSTQALAILPGLLGQYLRRAFLSVALERCHGSAAVCFGTIFSQTGARIDENVYVGAYCVLGRVHLERDVLIGSGVHIPSGPNTHGVDRLDRPIRSQPGSLRIVRIGAGTWIGNNAIVLNDVGRNSVIAAGAVVTNPIPDEVIAAGVPARVIRRRGEDSA